MIKTGTLLLQAACIASLTLVSGLGDARDRESRPTVAMTKLQAEVDLLTRRVSALEAELRRVDEKSKSQSTSPGRFARQSSWEDDRFIGHKLTRRRAVLYW